MDKIVEKLIPYLNSNQIAYQSFGTRIRIELPNRFGLLEIGDLDDGDVSILLVGENWQTTSSRLVYQCSGEESIQLFIRDIINGDCLLIEEQCAEKSTEKRIEPDLEQYLKQLPNRTRFKICNR